MGSLKVSSGAVYLQGNPRLCSMDVETLNQSFPGHVYGDMALYTSATCREIFIKMLVYHMRILPVVYIR